MTVDRKPARRAKVRRFPAWKLQDAKARLSEVVRKAREEGPQLVTYRGEDAVVVISAAELEELLPSRERKATIVDVLRGTELYKLDVERGRRRMRKLDL